MVRSSGIALACGALLLFAGACNHEDTVSGGMWGRTVEPRLTTTRSWHSCTRKLSPGHVVTEAQCAAAPVDSGRCPDLIDILSREHANRILVSRAQCTDVAIAALEHFSLAEAAAMSDLAGAYYVRAQRKDNPADLLRALDTAQRAVALNPQPEGAEFNLALILEALSLNNDAIDAWQRAAAVERGEWADEARAHRAALVREAAQDGEHQWRRVRAQIDAAIDAHDVSKTASLIAAFPATSQQYFEEEVLAQWAASPSPRQGLRVKTFSEALSQIFNDHYFVDVAAAIVNAPTRVLADLKQGHILFARARAAERMLGPQTAAPLYDEAARLLRQAGSPQYLLARIGHAGQSPLLTNDYGPSLKELDAVAAEARAHRYPMVLARVELNRLNTNQFLSRYNELFTSYDAAMTAYRQCGDWEDRAAADARAISAMSVVGLKDAAWREAFLTVRDAPRLLNWKTRFLLIGVTASAALDLGHPEAALLYQNACVKSAAKAPIAFLAISLRKRAAIELTLHRNDEAQRDVDAAIAAHTPAVDPSVSRSLEARLSEVQAEAALHADPSLAVSALTHAIEVAAQGEYVTFRASLLAERAEAFRRLGRTADAEADRRAALHELHKEEDALLGGRKPGSRDDLWNAYFTRFDETYDLLIRQLISEGRIDEAFRYADRARAFEPLDLVRKLHTAPAAFRELAAHPDDFEIRKLQEQLPPRTFLIEYRVFEDQTVAWVLGRNLFMVQTLTARRSDVKRWTEALQNAARARDSHAFAEGLEAPYDALLKKVLESVNRAPGGGAANIVIVPDRELRGLPFAALRDPETKTYFIEDHTLTISGSALLYVFAVLRDRELPSGDASALLIGNPAFDRQLTLARGLDPIPNAEREAVEIHTLYPGSEVLIGDAATAAQFLQRAGGSAIIHIAAHAIVNGDAPSQSFLLFTPSGGDHGVLNAETMIRELHTDKTRLLVLGACSSAGGLPVGAEGIAPLVRPVIAAGVPGVVGALWDIDDATATRLLVSFHRHYRQGSDAAAALREAQLEMLWSNNPGLRSGLTWAPFQAIGYASSPFAPIGDITKEKPP
jgi:CHAT domain-containing protein